MKAHWQRADVEYGLMDGGIVLTGLAGKLFYDIAGQAAKEIGEMVKDELRPYRAVRQARLAEKTARLLEARKVRPVPVSPKILLSVFENAGLEDDEEMHDRWATLLANAATPGLEFPISVVFVEILRQISPREATYLERLVAFFEECKNLERVGLRSVNDPEDLPLGSEGAMRSHYTDTGIPNDPTVLSQFPLLLNNLQRLGLIQRTFGIEGKSRIGKLGGERSNTKNKIIFI